ncbi:hypothetical protein CASFOL_028114 [Castilleja foliolosa]|uniref:Cyclin C-terminal domain-containing protein n=1 Tax=Castilleja foliolosa TaxID=1961234 RepID=A0ABD3CES8_9LAMI
MGYWLWVVRVTAAVKGETAAKIVSSLLNMPFSVDSSVLAGLLEQDGGVVMVENFRLVHYHPSVIACATMIYVIREIETTDVLEYQNRIINVLETSKEKIDDCHKLIVEAVTNDHSRKSCHKRKYSSIPNSPSGVIDAYFSSDSSIDSWAVVSPETFFKRSKALNHYCQWEPESNAFQMPVITLIRRSKELAPIMHLKNETKSVIKDRLEIGRKEDD